MDLHDVAWLSLRGAYSVVFLNAAWQCGKSREGINWTIDESRILFGDAGRVFGPAGILVMGAGGLSVLLGAWTELAGIALGVFLILGSVIHLRQRDRAGKLGESIKPLVPAAQAESVTQLATSAQLGHYSSAIKNLSLVGPAIFFAIMGSGPFSIARLWGPGSL